ncbi:hypothetical protein RB195_004408 [Necator americanus]|uniref:Fork-head domain-containing protein n=1 Tax=Necator americanus TaxID=51031 RepID=A0ABR1BI00_NECAM
MKFFSIVLGQLLRKKHLSCILLLAKQNKSIFVLLVVVFFNVQGKMSNHLSQTQCLAPPQQLPSFGTVPSLSFQPQCFAPTMSTILPPGPTYQSLNNTSPSSDSLFSVSTSLNSLPSECPPRRSDLDLKMETPDADELDDFFDLEKHQKARSASFGGSTQYSSQLAIARNGLFAPSLDTIGSVASGLYDSAENLNGRLGATSAASSAALLHSPDGNNTFSPSSCNMSSPVMNDQITPTGATDAGDSGTNAGASKKSTTRRNAWGNLSYADLITQAILQSPEKRLTLSQVYEWMVQNVPYFRDKGDSNSSAGWKRHIGYVSLERERERRPSRPLKWPLCRGSFDRSLVYRTALAGCSPSEGLRVVKSSLALWQLSSKNDRDGLPGRGDL